MRGMLKLDLATLHVESFTTLVPGASYGTVLGMSTPTIEIVADTVEGDVAEGGIVRAGADVVGGEVGGGQAVQQVAELPANALEDANAANEEGGAGARIAQSVQNAINQNPVLRSLWNLAKTYGPAAGKQAVVFGVIYEATVLAAKHVQSSNSPECMTTYLANVQAKWESEFGAGTFTMTDKQNTAQYCLQFPNLFNASC